MEQLSPKKLDIIFFHEKRADFIFPKHFLDQNDVIFSPNIKINHDIIYDYRMTCGKKRKFLSNYRVTIQCVKFFFFFLSCFIGQTFV